MCQFLNRGRENGYLLNSELRLLVHVPNHNICVQNLKKLLLKVSFSASSVSFSSFASISQSKNQQQKPLMNKNQPPTTEVKSLHCNIRKDVFLLLSHSTPHKNNANFLRHITPAHLHLLLVYTLTSGYLYPTKGYSANFPKMREHPAPDIN